MELCSHWSCGKIATDSPKLLDLTPTKLALSCCRRRLGDYLSHYIPEFKGPRTDVDLTLKAVLTFPVDGRRKAPAPGGSCVVQSLTCAVDGDTFLFHSPPKLCQKTSAEKVVKYSLCCLFPDSFHPFVCNVLHFYLDRLFRGRRCPARRGYPRA